MALNCGCPASACLDTIPYSSCKQGLGQIQRVMFKRTSPSINVELEDITIAQMKSLVGITTFLTLENDNKIIFSPTLYNPTFTAGTPRTYGGGNQTLGGTTYIIGREPTTFEGQMLEEPQFDVVKVMKELQCEAIGVFLIDEYGNIAGLNPGQGSGGLTIKPIPVKSFFVGDYRPGGFEEPDNNVVSWSFLPDWSDNLYIIRGTEIDYDPLTLHV